MKANFSVCTVLAIGLFTTEAAALTSTIEEVSPILANSAMDAFYVVETEDSGGNGAYHIYNNTTNLTLIGFGVSNPLATIATIDEVAGSGYVSFSNYGDAYGTGSSTYTFDLWDAFNLNSGNWMDGGLVNGLGDDVSAQDLFGDIGDALGGEGNANYFQILDATGLLPGQDGVDFGFTSGFLASFLFGVATDYSGNTFAFITATTAPEVPLPAGAVLLLTAIGGLGGFSLRRRRAMAA